MRGLTRPTGLDSAASFSIRRLASKFPRIPSASTIFPLMSDIQGFGDALGVGDGQGVGAGLWCCGWDYVRLLG